MVPSRSRKTARRLASAIERGPHRARHGLQLVGENGARIEHDAIVGDARDDGWVVCPQLRRERVGGQLLRVQAHERSEEHTSELQSLTNLVCRLLLEKKK